MTLFVSLKLNINTDFAITTQKIEEGEIFISSFLKLSFVFINLRMRIKNNQKYICHTNYNH